MSTLSPDRRRSRAELAAATASANRSPDDPEKARTVEAKRQEYRYIAARDYITEVVAAAPELTEHQRRQLAAILTQDKR